MRKALRFITAYAFIMSCPMMLGGFVSLALFGPVGMLAECAAWIVAFVAWFNGSELQREF